MLGCFNPRLDQIWTNPNVGLKMQLTSYQAPARLRAVEGVAKLLLPFLSFVL